MIRNLIQRVRLNELDRLFILFLVVLSFVPSISFFIGSSYPRHDTLHNFQTFSYIYSSFQLFGEFPVWNPYMAFGQTTSLYDLYANGPAQFLMMILGKVFSCGHDLFLFTCSLVIEHFIFVFGLGLFLAEIGLTRLEILFVCTAMTLATDYSVQLDLNYDPYSMLPFIFWLITAFFKNRDPRKLGILALFLFTFILFGRVPYMIVVLVYFSLLWAGIMFMAHRGWEWKKTSLEFFGLKKQIPFLFGVVAVCLLFGSLFFLKAQDFIKNYLLIVKERDAVLGTSQIQSFLNFGGYGGIEKWFQTFGGSPLTFDFNLFVGKVVLGGVIVALLFFSKLTKLEKQSFLSVAIMVVMTVLFTTPDLFPLARWCYFLPGMDRVRHIAYFGPMSRFLIVISSLYGFRLLRRDDGKGMLILFTLATFLLALWNKDSTSWIVIPLSVGLYLLKSRYFFWALFLASLVEISIYQANDAKLSVLETEIRAENTRKNIPNRVGLPEVVIRSSPRTREFQFRRMHPADSKLLAEHQKLSTIHVAYDNQASFLKEDYCPEAGRRDVMSRLVWQALSRKGMNFLCDQPKLQLVKQSSMMLPVAQGIDLTPQSGLDHGASDRIVPREFSPNSFFLEVLNAHSHAQWLLYLEAWHPWWRVSLDGLSVPLLESDHAFKTVEIPPGGHSIHFYIRPDIRALYQLHGYMLALAQIIFIIYLFRFNSLKNK